MTLFGNWGSFTLLEIQPIIVTGYHGTSEKAALQILEGDFKVSENSWEWLGHGIYFWQDAPYRALEWATEWLGRKGYKGPMGVIAAKIDLRNFIDLLDLKAMALLGSLAGDFLAQLEQDGRSLRNNPPLNRLDCGLFNFATNVLGSQEIEVAGYRAACVEGERITPDSPIFDKSHVQIAVIDKTAILEKWMVRTL
jgi:hypothetical protein